MLLEAKINLELDQLVNIIKALSSNQIEELVMKLTGEEKELKKRLFDIKSGKAKLLTEEELFADV